MNSENIYPREMDRETVYLKNVVTNPNIIVGEFTMYNDFVNDPRQFETNNVLYHYPVNHDKLVIGKFCSIASGVQFLMGPANHRISSVSTYPFHVFGGAWAQQTPPHLDQLPRKGDIVVGNDVWLGRDSLILPGVTIGDGAIVAARSVVPRDVAPYTVVGGDPARFLKQRFDDELIQLLEEVRWWDLPPEELAELLPVLCDPDLEAARQSLTALLARRAST